MKKVFLSILLFFSLIACQKEQTKKIVFVCTHGASRSPMASVLFNQIAKEKGLNFQAIHRAITPKEVFDKNTVESLAKDGLKLSGTPQKISNTDIKTADKVISFDCQLPFATENKIAWNGINSPNEDYDNAKEAITLQIEKLIVSLKNK